MKRIAVSLGSLTFILTNQINAQPIESSHDTYSIGESMVHDETEGSEIGSDVPALSELDDDIALLEEELELDDDFDIALEYAESKGEEKNNDLSSSQFPADPILSDTSLEQNHTPLPQNTETLRSEANVSNSSNYLSHSDSPLLALQSENEMAQRVLDEEAEEFSAEEDSFAVKESIDSLEENTNAVASTVVTYDKRSHKPIEVNLSQIFAGSPTIYLILLTLSILSVTLWLVNLISLKKFAFTNYFLIKNVRNKLMSNHFDEVISICKEDKSFFAKMMLSAVSSRKYGLQFMLESMKSEGKRASVGFWQRLSLIHDIAIIAPLIGLLGTVLGMLYAFYDLNRSIESISSLFDGLGVSVGTTVSGIFVAIVAMILHSVSKYRLIKSLTFVENEAVALAHLIDHKQQ